MYPNALMASRLNGCLLNSGFLAEQMCAKQQQTLLPTRAAHGRLHRNRDAVAWPFSTLCRVSGPTLFQMTFTAALWVAVFGEWWATSPDGQPTVTYKT